MFVALAQDVSFHIGRSFLIGYDKVKLGEELQPTGLASVKLFGCCKVDEVFVVSVDGDGVFCPNEVQLPFFKCFNHCHEFLIVDWVSGFGSLEFS